MHSSPAAEPEMNSTWRPGVPMGATGTLVVLIAAHNEEHVIVATLRSVLAQERRPDRIVVAADNCTDATVAAARSVPGVTVFETEANGHKKSGALNQAWRRYAADADLVVCIDADTILDAQAVGDWESEFRGDPTLGGCSAKFTMLVSEEMTFSERVLVRLQRAEFSKWTDSALRRGRKTSVLAGTACALRNDALRQLVAWRSHRDSAVGPWTYESLVEDFELTYRLREFGWETKVSATVRAYTDAMTDMRSLWAQRMKWQKGTVTDLLHFGVNRLTLRDWSQQALGLIAIAVRLMWITTLVAALFTRHLNFEPEWLMAPVLFLANDVKQSLRIPRRQRADVVTAALLFPQEAFACMRAAWFTAS
jgi:poly-beta-1,6-N-acetyl-D-glucosamine synthase